MGDLVERSETMLETYSDKQRPRCPFYGFNIISETMLDSQGNQCPLLSKLSRSYHPCLMEVNGEEPNWEKCPYLPKELKRVAESVAERKLTVIPKEFSPSKEIWQGIPFKHWKDYINSRFSPSN